MPVAWSLRASSASDAAWMAELRAIVMRPDLERLDRYDPVRVRQRFLDAFVPENTRVIVVDGEDVGLVAVRHENDGVWIEHFYLDPAVQGRGLGSAVLAKLLADGGQEHQFRLNVLQGSPARRLYERHGFALDTEDEVDVFMKAASPRN
ncbi:GNAT superfamily N-acetyltransferase [Microbacterium phyllosphaerae]|uniref:GNAT superfamily N-acetyltransferase n=2 Tax=Microbacterium phyllosphaerae TaxID=124798 RepID=A0ABS4WUD8_9MICO|nr:GNAT family N-acetyltransferase [Microbacterium phyllosphaerae]MBP2379819.1 GNAT superfamily N-acetyltransferase [Microbacterium phyllosphaerae]